MLTIQGAPAIDILFVNKEQSSIFRRKIEKIKRNFQEFFITVLATYLNDKIVSSLHNLPKIEPEVGTVVDDVLPGHLVEHLHDGPDQGDLFVARGSAGILFSCAAYKKVLGADIR